MSTVRNIISYNRPKQTPGRGDKWLADVAEELTRRIRKASRGFGADDCRLPDKVWSVLGTLVVEWAEDIHNDLGLWRAVEQHNRECLGTALPLVLAPGEAAPPLDGFDPRRLRFLVWNLWSFFKPDGVLSPTHPDLLRLTEICSGFLMERCPQLPKDSGIAKLLADPIEFGWDVKKKLAWLGCNSYLFRFDFIEAMRGVEREAEMLKVDDFLSTACSRWSGLGAADALASLIQLTPSERADLLKWHERHLSMYRIVDYDQSGGYVRRVFARNLVSGESYTIRVEQDLAACPYLPGRVVFGWLVPWHGEWCWTGEQHIREELPETEDPKIREELIGTLGPNLFRYCPSELAKAREILRKMHEEFVAFYGSDLNVFPNGSALHAAEKKRLEPWRNSHFEVFGLASASNEPVKLPEAFASFSARVAAYSSPETATEYARDFELAHSALAKKGSDLSAEQAKTLRAYIMDPEISPGFIKRIAAETGPSSILAAFGIHDYPQEVALEFLLRRNKGRFYRPVLPLLLPF